MKHEFIPTFWSFAICIWFWLSR